MKNADEAVGKVLAGLREVYVDPGFEERVERRVREAAWERGGAGRFGVWQWVGVGCVAMLLVGVGVNLRFREKHDFVAINVGSSGDARLRASVVHSGEIEEVISQRLKPRDERRGYGTAEAAPLSKPSFSSRVAMPGSTRVRDGANGASVANSPAVAGGVDAGFPAPPLPLTAQERLLLRAAVRGDPQPAAVLEVSVLPAHDAEETAEFVEFFGQDRQVEPSTTGDSE